MLKKNENDIQSTSPLDVEHGMPQIQAPITYMCTFNKHSVIIGSDNDMTFVWYHTVTYTNLLAYNPFHISELFTHTFYKIVFVNYVRSKQFGISLSL